MKHNNRISFVYEGSVHRLDKILLERLSKESGVTRSRLKGLIEVGAVLVNGASCLKAGTLVKNNSEITVLLPAESSGESVIPQDIPLDILFEDESILIINKQKDFVVHPGAGVKDKTLLNALAHHFEQRHVTPPSRMGLVHRLDKDTTGILVVCKNEKALSDLSQQFANREVQKEYLALVFYTPRSKHLVALEDEGTIESAIGRHPTKRIKMTVVSAGGRKAVTKFKVINRFQYGALVSVNLLTGRTHQIRVHLESVKSPIVGDKTYGTFFGMPESLKRACEKFGRQALHAHQISFIHPDTKKQVSFQAKIPSDMEYLIKQFETV